MKYGSSTDVCPYCGEIWPNGNCCNGNYQVISEDKLVEKVKEIEEIDNEDIYFDFQ